MRSRFREREKFVRSLGLEGKVYPRRMLEESERDAILALLYLAPSRLVIIPIQDLFGWSARINRPGTISDFELDISDPADAGTDAA